MNFDTQSLGFEARPTRDATEELINTFAAFDSGLAGWNDDCIIPKQASEGFPIAGEMGSFVICR